MFFKDEDLDKLPNIRHAFFTRQGGFSADGYESLNCDLRSRDDKMVVARNRDAAMAAIGLENAKLVTLDQIHGPDVIVVEPNNLPPYTAKADALVTSAPNIALGILTADCVPLLFVDPFKSVIGAAHAGWRGAKSGVAEATIEAMKKLGAKPDDIHVAIGPCIQQASYEVSADYRADFTKDDAASDRYFAPSQKPGHFMFDLPSYTAQRLIKAGIQHIGQSPFDTCKEETLFFSHRRTTLRGEKGRGSLLSAIAITQ